jgi:hypothetical protein
MLDLSHCKNVDGKWYCWDAENNRLVEIKIVPVELDSFATKVISAFMQGKGLEEKG